jgi:simple sugar transport system permease protein
LEHRRGDLTIGAIAAGNLALELHGNEAAWALPAIVAIGALGGMLWAPSRHPAQCFSANEILVSLMLTYVASYFRLSRAWAWRDPQGFNFPQSRLFHDAALFRS